MEPSHRSGMQLHDASVLPESKCVAALAGFLEIANLVAANMEDAQSFFGSLLSQVCND